MQNPRSDNEFFLGCLYVAWQLMLFGTFLYCLVMAFVADHHNVLFGFCAYAAISAVFQNIPEAWRK